MQLIFARQSAPNDPSYSGERLLNLYAQPHPDRGVGPFILAPSPGLTTFATLAEGRPVRAIYQERGVIYAACNGILWSVNEATGAVQSLGGITDSPDTYIEGNGLQIAVVAGGQYRVHTKATGSLLLTNTGAITEPETLTMLDNYIILTESDGQRFQISGLQAAESMDGLDFASAESAPDKIVRAFADHSELWMFGSQSSEVFANTGNADFPFQRISGGVVERGCAFPRSVAADDNSVFWVGEDRLVYRVNGYTPQVVSTPYISGRLLALDDGADVNGFTYSYRNAKHYVLRLPDGPSLVYDASTSMWHERMTGDRQPFEGRCATDDGRYIGGENGRIYTLGGIYDGDVPVWREGVSLPISSSRERFSLNRVQLHFQTGETEINRDAQVALSVSKNGVEFGLDRWRSLGDQGDYDKLIRWHGLGSARQFQIRFRITDPIETALYGATVEAA